MVELDKTEVILIALILTLILGVPYYILALSRGSFSLMNIPPTDISKAPQLPGSGSPGPEDVIPSELLNQPVIDVIDISSDRYTGFRILYGPGTGAEDFEVIIGRAKSEEIALGFISDSYSTVVDGPQLPGYPGVVSVKKESDWFTYSGGYGSIFMWKTGVWFFGVRASLESTRDQVTEELLDHVRAMNQS